MFILLLSICVIGQVGGMIVRPSGLEKVYEVTFSRTAVGPVVIVDVDQKGKYIELENISSGKQRRNVVLDGYKLVNEVDGEVFRSFTFKQYDLTAGSKMKVWAKDFNSKRRPGDLLNKEEDIWGAGKSVYTYLYNDKNEVVATHTRIVKIRDE